MFVLSQQYPLFVPFLIYLVDFVNKPNEFKQDKKVISVNYGIMKVCCCNLGFLMYKSMGFKVRLGFKIDGCPSVCDFVTVMCYYGSGNQTNINPL